MKYENEYIKILNEELKKQWAVQSRLRLHMQHLFSKQ